MSKNTSYTDYGKTAYQKTENLSRQTSYLLQKVADISEITDQIFTEVKFGEFVEKTYAYTTPYVSPNCQFLSQKAQFVKIKFSAQLYMGNTVNMAFVCMVNGVEVDRPTFRLQSYSQTATTNVCVPVVAGINTVYFKLMYAATSTVSQYIGNYEICVNGFDLFKVTDEVKLCIAHNATKFAVSYLNTGYCYCNVAVKDAYALPYILSKIVVSIKVVQLFCPMYNTETGLYDRDIMYLWSLNPSLNLFVMVYNGTDISSYTSAKSSVNMFGVVDIYNKTRYAMVFYTTISGEVHYAPFSEMNMYPIYTMEIAYTPYVNIIGVADTVDRAAFICIRASDMMNCLFISDIITETESAWDMYIPPTFFELGSGRLTTARWLSNKQIQVNMLTKEGMRQITVDISGAETTIVGNISLPNYDQIFTFTEGSFNIYNRSVNYVPAE